MEAFKTVIWIINIFSSLAIIGLVLMQHGKGADAGAGFSGSGSAQGVFGSAGNANFLSRMTALSATIFFASCLALGYINTNSHHKSDLDFSDVKQTSQTNSQPLLPNNKVDVNHIASTPAIDIDKTAALEAASSTHEIIGTQKAAVAATAVGAVAKKLTADNIKDKTIKNEKNQSKAKESKSVLKDKKTLDKKKHEKLVKNIKK